MNSRMVVDKERGLREANHEIRFPMSIRWAARIISWIFHPVFVPVYITLFIVYVHPYLFAGFSAFNKMQAVLMSVLMYCFFPLVTVGLLKGLKLIENIFLETQKDRVIPLISSGIWYFWIWNVWHNLPEYPAQAVQLALGTWIAVSLALLANIIMKVSLHAIAMGSMLAFILLLAWGQSIHFGSYLSVAFLIAGMVCTSRLIISNHRPVEVYAGLAIGMVSMFLGPLFDFFF